MLKVMGQLFNQKGVMPLSAFLIVMVIATTSLIILNEYQQESLKKDLQSESTKETDRSFTLEKNEGFSQLLGKPLPGPIGKLIGAVTSSDPTPSPEPSPYKRLTVLDYIKQRGPSSAASSGPSASPKQSASPGSSSQPTASPGATSAPTSTPAPSPNPAPTPASTKASLALSPSSGTYNKGCDFFIDVNMDAAIFDIDGVDLVLKYDKDRVQATEITTVTTFNNIGIDFVYKEYNNDTGMLYFTGVSRLNKPLKGTGKLATLNFKVKTSASTGEAKMEILRDPNSVTMSNIIEVGTVENKLEVVVNGNYTVGSGSCN